MNEVLQQRDKGSPLIAPVVVLISADADSADLMAAELLEAGYDVKVAGSLMRGFVLARELSPAVVITGLVLPDGAGTEVIVRLSRVGVPVMVVTAKWDVESMVALLGMGAVDYLAGPFDMRELLARVAVQVRARSSGSGWDALVVGELTLDVDGRQLLVGEKEVYLSAKERKLLLILMQKPGVVFSFQELMDTVWGSGGETKDTLTVHISSIRRKLHAENAHRYLVTVRGFGYVIRKPV